MSCDAVGVRLTPGHNSTMKALTLEKILLTHGHLDHAAATAELAGLKGVPIEGPHPDE